LAALCALVGASLLRAQELEDEVRSEILTLLRLTVSSSDGYYPYQTHLVVEANGTWWESEFDPHRARPRGNDAYDMLFAGVEGADGDLSTSIVAPLTGSDFGSPRIVYNHDWSSSTADVSCEHRNDERVGDSWDVVHAVLFTSRVRAIACLGLEQAAPRMTFSLESSPYEGLLIPVVVLFLLCMVAMCVVIPVS
jgi:hypothetical protein